MKQCLRIFVLATLIASAAVMNVQAQQVRYLDEIFTDVNVDTTIVYGKNYNFPNYDSVSIRNLVFDIYTPVGDTRTDRPLVLLSHNGSFLPEASTAASLGFCLQGRKDNFTVEMCKRLARRGYVAVSFDYRLGWAAQPGTADSVMRKTIIQAVYKAQQDAKGLIRYFKNNYVNGGNTYGIDTGKIVLGGSNSGAYVALAANSLNDTNELNLPKFVDLSGKYLNQAFFGDFDGFGGIGNLSDNYPGFSSNFQAVISCGGAVGDTSWIQPGERPVIAFHGVEESTTPYNTGVVLSAVGVSIVTVSGAGDFMPVAAAEGLNNKFNGNNFLPPAPKNYQGGVQTSVVEGLYPFYGQEFEPWNWYPCVMNGPLVQLNVNASEPKAKRYIDTIIGYTTPRLYKLFVDSAFTNFTATFPTGIYEVANGTIEMQMYPNPTSNQINITLNTLQKPLQTIQVYDATGRRVKQLDNLDAYVATVDVTDLTPGLYNVAFKLTDGTMASRNITIQR